MEKAQDMTAAGVVIVAFGDSVTQGFTAIERLESEAVYHRRFARSLQAAYPLAVFSVINAGMGGQTAKGAMCMLDRDVLGHAPDLVIIGFGLNDAYQGGLDGVEVFSATIETMVSRIRAETPADLALLTPNFMLSAENENIHPSHQGYEATKFRGLGAGPIKGRGWPNRSLPG